MSRPVAGRRALTGVLAVLLLLGAAAGGAGAWQENRTAAQWRDLQQRQSAVLAATRRVQSSTSAALTASQRALAAARSELSTAQAQVRQVANAKAQAEDKQVLAQQSAKKLSTIATAQGQVQTALTTCIDDQHTLLQRTLDLSANGPVDPATVQPQIDTVNAACQQAASAEDSLRALITSLGG